METLETKPQDEMAQVGGDYLSTAKALTVLSNGDYTQADSLRQMGRAHKRKIDEFMDPLIDVAHKSHRGLTAAKKNLLAPVKEGITAVGDKMEVWDAEQKRIAEEKRKQEEKELLEREKERTRKDIVETAVALDEAGDTESANELLEQAENPVFEVPKVALKPNTPKVATSYRTRYFAEVTDKKLVPLEYMVPDMSALNKVANALKGEIVIPGVTITSKRTPIW